MSASKTKTRGKAILSFFSKLLPTGPGTVAKHFEYKMLLIGETGSGKTSFLNLLCNCNSVMSQRLGSEFDGAALAQFRNYNDFTLETHQACEFEVPKLTMKSNTSAARLYNVKVGNIKVGIIDTPGFGDTEGLEVDEKNIKNTVRYLDEEVEFIHCICLVVNGRQCRMNTNLKLVLTQITSVLPRKALENLVVVFTNTADELELNFDPAALEEFFGLKVDKRQQFCIENPFCKYEKVKRKRYDLSMDEIAKSMQSSFKDTAKMLDRMCVVMRDFEKVPTDHFTMLYAKRQEIEESVLKILAAYTTLNQLGASIAEAEEKIKEALKNKEMNKGFMIYQEYEDTQAVKTEKYNTICGACCSNCHVSCQLETVFKRPDVKECQIFGLKGKNDHCSTCGHETEHHYCSKLKFKKEIIKRPVVVDVLKSNFDRAETDEEIARTFVESLGKERKESEHEREMLSHKLLQTLDDFSQMGVNRSYKTLLETQIAVIKERLSVAEQHENHHECMRQTLKSLEEKLHVITEILKRPWSRDMNPEFQHEWACRVFGFDYSEPLTKEKIERTFKTSARKEHPDKGGNHEFYQRIVRARDILLLNL